MYYKLETHKISKWTKYKIENTKYKPLKHETKPLN